MDPAAGTTTALPAHSPAAPAETEAPVMTIKGYSGNGGRPQRAKVPKKRQQQELKDVTVSLSDEEENTAVQAAIAELGVIQETQTTDKEIRRNEDDLLALLQVDERQQEPLLAKGAGSQPPDKDDDNDQEKTGDNEINAQETGKVPVAPVVNGVIAPSAPASEEEGLVAPPEQIPLQPKPSAPPPSLPTQTTMPRAFHEIAVPVLAGIDVVPSAPPDFEGDSVEVADHSSTTPSALSLSPTASKKLHRRNPEKLNPVVRMPANGAAAVTVEGASVAVRSSFAESHLAEKEAGKHNIYPALPREVKAAATTETKKTVADYEQLLKKKHIRVKLEPFINYEMNLMRTEASQKRQDMKIKYIKCL